MVVGRSLAVRILVVTSLWAAFGVNALAAVLKGVDCHRARGDTVVDLHIEGGAHYHVFGLTRPERVVIDLDDTKPAPHLAARGDGLVGDVRFGIRKGVDLRVVLDLRSAAGVSTRYLSDSRHGDRLMLILHGHGASATGRHNSREVSRRPKARPVLVMIDPGHGGRDPGTRGRHGLEEKVVTLSIGRDVARLIDRHKGVRAMLTRTTDRYVSLPSRVADAERHHADIFVSIHANAYPRDPAVNGGAVYMLSEHGASSSEARAVAAAENSDDPDGSAGLPLTGKAPVDQVLVDMSQRWAMAQSYDLGADILHRLGRIEPLYVSHLQRANFAVLRDPAVPAVLVETAFLSNPHQAWELHHARFRYRMARAIADGIMAYLRNHHPLRHHLHDLRASVYEVKRGDTLSAIAHRAGTSVSRLRRSNHLHSDDLRVGQILALPEPAS